MFTCNYLRAKVKHFGILQTFSKIGIYIIPVKTFHSILNFVEIFRSRTKKRN